MTRLFGTNGIRGVVGADFTPAFVARVASAIVAAAPDGEPIVLGRDTRSTSEAFAGIVAGTLAAHGCDVVDVGMLPTPAVQHNVVALRAGLGVAVTASHNPPHFNGIKVFGSRGVEIARSSEEAVEASFGAQGFRPSVYTAAGTIRRDGMAAARYLDAVAGRVDVAAVRRCRFSVVADCGNGASVATTPELLRRLGCRAITLNGHPDGTFPGRSPEPTAENLGELRAVVRSFADLGVAHDGDADRAAFVTDDGEAVPPEMLLALVARDEVRRRGGGTVVVPVSASLSVEEAVAAEGGRTVYVAVGARQIVHGILAERAVFGGEDNGGLIFPEHLLARDGAMTLARVLEICARAQRGLGDLLREVPRWYTVRRTVPSPSPDTALTMDHVLRYATEAVGGDPERIATLDGVRAVFGPGWVLVRPSGTEPIFRIVADARTPGLAEELAGRGESMLRRALAETGAAA